MFPYLKAFIQTHPFLLKSTISGGLCAFADLISQKYIEKCEQIDYARNIKFLGFGLLWFGPLVQAWYTKILPKISQRYFHSYSPTKQIRYRLFVDCLIFGPLNTIGFFFFNELMNEGQLAKVRQNFSELKSKIIVTQLYDYSIWIPANYINFKYIPIFFQGLYVGFFSVLFSIGLSYIAHQPKIMESLKRIFIG